MVSLFKFFYCHILSHAPFRGSVQFLPIKNINSSYSMDEVKSLQIGLNDILLSCIVLVCFCYKVFHGDAQPIAGGHSRGGVERGNGGGQHV